MDPDWPCDSARLGLRGPLLTGVVMLTDYVVTRERDDLCTQLAETRAENTRLAPDSSTPRQQRDTDRALGATWSWT